MAAITGTLAQRISARPSPIGSPIRMPINDSDTVTMAPWKMAAMSPPLMTVPCLSGPASEFRFEGHRQVGKRLAEPLLLQFGKPAAGLFLGDELVQVGHQFRAVLAHRPGRKRFAGYRLAEFKHLGLFRHQGLQVDDGVDDIIDTAERQILIGLWIGRIFDDLAEFATILLERGGEFGKTTQQRAARLHADGLAVEILDRRDRCIVLALDVIMRGISD